jgi:AraC family cel operon transcriptional repressor
MPPFWIGRAVPSSTRLTKDYTALMLRLLFQGLGVRADDCHVARTSVRGPAKTTLHTHDFLEIFYVIAGSGRHHVNRTSYSLTAGDLAFVRAPDTHCYSSFAGDSLEFFNVAFSALWWKKFVRVLPARVDARGLFAGKRPPRISVPAAQRGEFRTKFEALLGGGEPVLRQLEICTAVTRLLLHQPELHRRESPPAWLEAVIDRLREPDFVNLGLPGFYRAAGRSPEHIARTCQKFLAATPTELLNRARIGRAKAQLFGSDEKICTVALENGFENLGYFYRVFRRCAGCSPHQWRREHSAAGVVPS